ncbi:WD40 repeat-like protein [Tilletiaria anomala UBC 951]|uniref:WD40 repeat-like protein n=1 Tax=Tilletiaria anomala (strain ATCC 24038 / CBS 436.72 / UBC 951) TaxID=1037660 RepID=A0A066VXT0_TILAU|nr:WD40 repeat-like protein [Tilletiaria anomala UBC 951]KDN45098.1 WD40 repeat-like protein [Tilletiaria anomala UBC 951]
MSAQYSGNGPGGGPSSSAKGRCEDAGPLNKLSGALASTKAYLTPFASATAQSSSAVREGHQAEANKLLADIAPHIMRPRMLQAAAAASASISNASHSSNMLGLQSGSLRLTNPGRSLVRFGNMVRHGPITSTDLRIQEASDQILLTAAMGDVEEPTGIAAEVSLLRGYQATIPSALEGKSRRRKARGRDAPHMGLKSMGNSARGLLTDGDAAESQRDVSISREARKARRSAAAKGKEIPLSEEELQEQLGDILTDKENLSVRRMLLNSEMSELEAKIAALENVKHGLHCSLVGLQEEELELNDEFEGVSESLELLKYRKTMPGGNAKMSITSTSATSNHGSPGNKGTVKRKKGPLFLPSEHDDLPPGVAFMTLTGHTAPLTALDFSEPYGTLVSSASDDSVRVWDLTVGSEVGRLRGHSGFVKCLQVEDELCITGSADSTLKLWDLRRVEDYEARLSLAQQGDVSYQNLNELAEGRVDAGDVTDDPYNPCLRTLEGHSKAVTALYFDDNCLVTGASDKTLRQWDLNTGQCVLTMDILWAISNPASTQSLSSSMMLDASNSGFLPISPRASMLGSPSLRASSVFGGSGAGNNSASVNAMMGSMVLPSVTGGNFSHPTPAYADGSWEMYQDFVGGVQFWGYALASGSGDGGVRMWDMRTGQAHRTLLGHTAPVTCLQFDETYVISGSLDRSIKIWDLRTGVISDTIKYDYPVTSLQFDSRKIVATTGENGVNVYNRTTLQHSTLSLNGHTAPVERVRYMDRYGVSGGKDNLIKVWAM